MVKLYKEQHHILLYSFSTTLSDNTGYPCSELPLAYVTSAQVGAETLDPTEYWIAF